MNIGTTEAEVRKNPLTAQVSGLSKDGHTAKVFVTRVVVDARYGKRRTRRTVLLVDTTGKSVSIGQQVEIVPCRRMSKQKSWRVL
jgi:ribosomal protein S17